MLIELKRKDVLDLYFAIKGLDNEDYSKWFTYSLILTEEKLRPVANAIIGVSKPSEAYVDYETERENIINKYAELDEDNKRIINNNQVKIQDEKIGDCIHDMDILDLEYKDVIELRNKDLEEYYDLLDEEIEVDVEPINLKHFPDTISKRFMLALMPLVKKTEEE